ncbi:MAG: hypothetical protein WD250_09410 [Egibacteraceae bacterium]
MFGNVPAGLPPPDAWSLRHPVAYTLIWIAIILAVFVPLATRTYASATTK